jgi:transcriptional regulator with XRE-family HTH domain
MASDETVKGLLDLGSRVRMHRKQQGLRIDDAAALLGVSTGMLSRMENGQPVGSDKMMRVLQGLGLCLRLADKTSENSAGR